MAAGMGEKKKRSRDESYIESTAKFNRRRGILGRYIRFPDSRLGMLCARRGRESGRERVKARARERKSVRATTMIKRRGIYACARNITLISPRTLHPREGTRERGVCEDRWQGVSPGQRRAAQSRVARTVNSVQFRSDIRATSDLRADRPASVCRTEIPYQGNRPRVETGGRAIGVATRRRHACRHDGKKGCVVLLRHVRFSTAGLIPVPNVDARCP